MAPKLRKVNQSNQSSKKASPGASMHDIYHPKQTNLVSNKDIENESEQSSFNLDDQPIDNKLQNKSQTIEKVLNRLGLQKQIQTKQNDQQLQMLVGNIVQNCVGTIDTQSNLDHYEKMYQNQYKQILKSKTKKSSIIVSELTEVQKIQMMSNQGITAIAKQIRLFFKKISLLCCSIVEHNLFQSTILLIIILNSVYMALDDPLTSQDSNPTIQTTFIVLYTLQMVIKIFANGFLFNQNAYLRDLWNILDFVIVLTSLLPYVITIGFSVNSLRAIRVLRPLKTITKVKALKMIVSTLFYSFSLVMDSLYILIFVMVVFSIAGTQLFSGILKNRCIELATGHVTDLMCVNGNVCSDGFVCGRGINNPNFSIQNFDTFLWSMLSVFQTLTMEGWSEIMINLQKCYSPLSVIYSLLIVFFCQYVLLNMTMAILKYKYSQVKGNTIEQDQVQQTEYQPQFLKKIGVFKDITTLAIQPPLQRYYSNDKIFVGAIQFNKSMSNSLDKCLESDFQAPPATRKSLGRIKTQNLSKNLKFDLSKLNRKGKIDQFKWDAKTLQFQSIQLNSVQPGRQSMRNIKQVQQKQQKQQNNDMQIAEQSNQQSSMNSLQMQSESDASDKQDEKHMFIDQKIYEMQMKLGQSRKNINDNPLTYTKSNKVIQSPIAQNKMISTKKSQMRRPQIKQMDDVLGLVNQTLMFTQRLFNNKKIPNKINVSNIVIPQINFNDYKVDRLYQRFGDLGQYRVKRLQKVNQLNFFNIKQQKKHLKVSKKQQTNILKQITQETSLDIKQLQLVNQLIKKKMKCRIKQKQVLDQQIQYDKTRVLVYKASKQQQKKAEQLQINLKNLIFHITYKSFYEQGEQALATPKLSFTRSFDTEYKGLRITEFVNKKQKNQKSKMGSTRSIVSKTANYMKLLQSHKMEQKIQFQQDKIMSIFFKKQKQTKEVQPLNKYEQQFKRLKQQDIFNRHGHIKIECPIRMSQQSQQQFLQSINIKDEQYEIYIKGILGIFTVLRKKTLLFINKPFYDNLMLLFVLANTITLAMNGLVDTSNEIFIKLNMTFTLTFAIDLGLKIFSYGFDFFSDIMNLFDTFVVSISIVQLAVGTGGSNLSALRSVRILRAFRVLRITRLIRSLNYMKIVMSVVSSVITQFIYIFMLLALFIFIYTLLGMQIFGGQLLPYEVTGVRQNFDTFFNAVFSVFQILTVQNWNDIQTAVLNSSTSYFSIVYIVSWIFIGNWILLNLLQAILLDGFDKDSSPETPQQQDQSEYQDLPNPQDEETSSKSTDQQSFKDNYKKQDASLLLFYPTTPIRVLAVKITSSKLFQNLIIFCIALSSVKLVLDTYISEGSQLQRIAKIIDYAFNGIFILQFALKVIARGFIFGQNSYIKDNWSKLDFLIVTTAIIDMIFTDIDLSILKLFRTLRPLRIVSRNLQMKIIISSLAQSMCGILNVMIIIVCVFIMFGILGINLLQNKLNFCNSIQYTVGDYGPYNVDQAGCIAQGGAWTTHFINFDNIVNSLLSMYVFSTRQNWPFYVYTFIDSSQTGPSKDANQLLYMLFSVVIIFVCSYFFMDLLVGVLFMNFHQAEQKIRPKQLTDKQINWKNLQKIIIQEDPCFQLYLQPQNPIRKLFYNIVTCKPFELGITICILVNISVMIATEDDESILKDTILSNINFVFSIIFICEMVLKLSAFGRAYFLSGWNIFDFFVVMASVLDIILAKTGTSNSQSSALSILPQIARIFRVLRVTRLLRMFKRFKGLQKLIETFIFSFPALARGLSIVSLFLFISSVLASYLFSNIQSDYSGTFDNYRNFQNFHMSIQALFVATTGENWYFYMYQTTKQGYVVCKQGTTCVQFAYLFFWLVYIFFSQKVFMELFVLIVLDQFESNYIKQNNPLGIFALFQDDFRSNWIQITTKYNSQKIQTKRLIDLLLALKQPLGLGKQQLMSKYEQELKQNDKLTEQQINTRLKQLDLKLKKNAAKQIQKMDIIKNRLYLGYHQTFYRFAKLALMPDFMEKATESQKHLLDQIHKQSQEKLIQLMPQGNNYDYQEGQQIVNSDPLNPIQLILFSQMIIKSWHNYSLKFHSQKKNSENKNDPNYSLNNSCASDVAQAELQKLPVQRKMEKRKGMLETGKNRQVAYEFRAMPNIDDHYQNQKKRLKKGPSSNSKGLRGFSSINALQRLTSSQDRKTDHQQ